MTTEQVVVFLKYPDPGKVKTRLAATTSNQFAAETYSQFVKTILEKLEILSLPIHLSFGHPVTSPQIQKWLGKNYDYSSQSDGDLGHRLATTFEAQFKQGKQKVIIIGSDSPDLPPHIYIDALKSLETHDCCIGPTKDGGYYLIGLTHNGYSKELFRQIDWSTEKVFQQTSTKITHLKKSIRLLPEWYDIDTQDDLRYYLRN